MPYYGEYYCKSGWNVVNSNKNHVKFKKKFIIIVYNSISCSIKQKDCTAYDVKVVCLTMKI